MTAADCDAGSGSDALYNAATIPSERRESMDELRVGYIGLGLMGKSMARNILKAGYPVIVHNRSRAAVEELVSEGAQAAGSPAAAAVAGGCRIHEPAGFPRRREGGAGPGWNYRRRARGSDLRGQFDDQARKCPGDRRKSWRPRACRRSTRPSPAGTSARATAR